ncbi:MAG: AarF/ABC1/UbiB kinase family protein [Candidatus Binatia bacterium]|nr:AarF/ABC1/UbiB kinase family protein [Candidatus Binatia bacterium]
MLELTEAVGSKPRVPANDSPPTGLRRAPQRRSRRFAVVAGTVGQIYAGYKTIQVVEKLLGSERVRWLYRRQHATAAQSIYHTAVRLEGLLIKACQFLGTRADILPHEYIETLSQLQDRVPPRSFADVLAPLVERELKRPLGEVFADWDPKPLAAASLAQVHRARLRDGRDVVLKIQYPEIAHLVEADLANLRFLFGVLARLERNFDLRIILREIQHHVPLELDFQNEARNAERIGRNLAHRSDVIVPRVVWEYSTRRVLVLEYVEGIKVTQVQELDRAGIDRNAVARLLSDVFCQQILRDGFFHADPHPGNILVQPGPRIVLLDFGLAKTLPANFQVGLVQLAAAILMQNRTAAVDAFRMLGFRTKNDDPGTLLALGDAFLGQVARSGKAYAERELVEAIRENLVRVLRENPIVEAPSDILLVLRVMGLLSGIGKQLNAEIDLLQVMMPHLTSGLQV